MEVGVCGCFQSTFYLEKCANNIFLFFKNYFWDQHIKMIWKHQKHITSKKKKKNFQIFSETFLKSIPKQARHLKEWLEGVWEYSFSYILKIFYLKIY
jgi:hypothetical protein